MNYEVVDIEFVNEENVEEREVHVTLDNGSVVHICACQESFEQYNGTLDELKTTLDIAESSVEWLHGGERPNEVPY
jgi:intracellular sulfur oxidation DsrE/DsrF family protein